MLEHHSSEVMTYALRNIPPSPLAGDQCHDDKIVRHSHPPLSGARKVPGEAESIRVLWESYNLWGTPEKIPDVHQSSFEEESLLLEEKPTHSLSAQSRFKNPVTAP